MPDRRCCRCLRLVPGLLAACAFLLAVAAIDVVAVTYPPWMEEVPRLWISRCRLSFDALALTATALVIRGVRGGRPSWLRRAKQASAFALVSMALLSMVGTVWAAVELARGSSTVVGTANFLWETVLVATVVLHCARVVVVAAADADAGGEVLADASLIAG